MLVLFAASNDGSEYGDASIGAPGNAKNVLTVGSAESTTLPTTTVSYFSSRGPTSDGRLKVSRSSNFVPRDNLMHTRCARHFGAALSVTTGLVSHRGNIHTPRTVARNSQLARSYWPGR